MFDPERFLQTHPAPAVMGIVNSTGDSFSEGAASAPESAFRRGMELAAAGADILDIGGESTRPGSAEVTLPQELDRVIPVLNELKKALPDMIFSIDTRHAAVAEEACKAGAVIINDVGMGVYDPEMLAVAARTGAVIVLNHSRSTPDQMQQQKNLNYPEGVRVTVTGELLSVVERAEKAGIPGSHIWLDPGIGFAKSAEQCRELIAEAALFPKSFPWLWGISRKSFMGGAVESRGAETLRLELKLAAAGAAVIRTHDVRALTGALKERRMR